jgi:hypothetical protein
MLHVVEQPHLLFPNRVKPNANWDRWKEAVEAVDLLPIVFPITVHQQLSHYYGGYECLMTRLLDPYEDSVRQLDVRGVRLNLINERTCVESDIAMTAKKTRNPGYSQL